MTLRCEACGYLAFGYTAEEAKAELERHKNRVHLWKAAIGLLDFLSWVLLGLLLGLGACAAAYQVLP